MAAAIVTAKKMRRRPSLEFIMEDNEIELHSKVPEDRKRKLDIELKMLLGGRWELRRIILTRNELFFSVPKEEQVRDHIPLHEITVVETMHNAKSIDLLRQSLVVDADPSNSKPQGKDTIEKNNKDKQDWNTMMFVKIFQIETIPNGHNSGRTYFFHADTKETSVMLVEVLHKFTEAAKQRMIKKSRFQESQKWVRTLYYSKLFQFISSALIVMNFGLSIAAAQVSVGQASKESRERVLDLIDTLDLFFVLVFTGELVVNMYANWWRPFFNNPWSVFDLIIVGVSLIGLSPLGVPLGMLLLARSCRVLRIFGKFKAVAQIFAALSWSIMPMANVFFIIFVIASIYSVIAVSFFAHHDPEHLSSFARAFVSMFRITIGSVEWWFETFPAVQDNGSLNVWPSVFLISYVITVTWVFFQVSIAVLLDNFLSASNAMKLAETVESIREKQASKLFKNPLDPLLLRLSKDYIDEVDLSQRLHELFKVLDSSGSGWLTSHEFQVEMKKLDVNPRIFVSDSDFIAITRGGSLCNDKGQLGMKEFEIMMREQIRMYTLSRLSSTSEYWSTSDQEFTPIGALKQILMEQITLRRDHEASLAEMRGALAKSESNLERVLASLATLTAAAASGGDRPKGPPAGRTERPVTRKAGLATLPLKIREPGSETDPSPRELRPTSMWASIARGGGRGSVSPARRSAKPRRMRSASSLMSATANHKGDPPQHPSYPQLRAPGAPGMQVPLLDVSSPIVLVNHAHRDSAVDVAESAADNVAATASVARGAAASVRLRQAPKVRAPQVGEQAGLPGSEQPDLAGHRDSDVYNGLVQQAESPRYGVGGDTGGYRWDASSGVGRGSRQSADLGAAGSEPPAATGWGRGRSFSMRRLKIRGASESNLASKLPANESAAAGVSLARPFLPLPEWTTEEGTDEQSEAAMPSTGGSAGLTREAAPVGAHSSETAAKGNHASVRRRGQSSWHEESPPATTGSSAVRQTVRTLGTEVLAGRNGNRSSGDGSGDADDGGGLSGGSTLGGAGAVGPGRSQPGW